MASSLLRSPAGSGRAALPTGRRWHGGLVLGAILMGCAIGGGWVAWRQLMPRASGGLPGGPVGITEERVSLGAVLFTEEFNRLTGGPWQRFSRRGETQYALHDEGGNRVLRAESRAAASGLITRLPFDAVAYPLLRWRWRVEDVVAGADLRTRRGSDAAARVCVIFARGRLLGLPRVLNYVWATSLPEGAIVRSASYHGCGIIAVESGATHVGEWRTETRHLVEDYEAVFGEAPPAVEAIAVMTDTDDTGGAVVAYYDGIQVGRLADGGPAAPPGRGR